MRATVRDDWEWPERPSKGPWVLAVQNQSGWCLYWYRNDKAELEIVEGDSAWPFNETDVSAEDWEALGIEVVGEGRKKQDIHFTKLHLTLLKKIVESENWEAAMSFVEAFTEVLESTRRESEANGDS